MVRSLSMLFLATFFLLAHTVSAGADSDAQAFLEAIDHYEAQEYSEAAEGFRKLADNGLHNGKLYYNIANAFLKQGRLGPAILWYERALRLIPGDPDLEFNLDYARTLIKDEPGTLGSPLLQVLFFWKDLLRISSWQWVGISASMLFWSLLAISCFFKKSALKPFLFGCLGLALLSSGTAVYLTRVSLIHSYAVILDKAVSIRSGFSSDTTELFVLHEGSLVAVEKQAPGYIKIRFTKDKIGWVSNTMAEII